MDDPEPTRITDEYGCVSVTNVTLNLCVAKNGGCETDSILNYSDRYTSGVTAFWHGHHEVGREDTVIRGTMVLTLIRKIFKWYALH